MVTELPSRAGFQKALIIACMLAPLGTFITTFGAYWTVSTYSNYVNGNFWDLVKVRPLFTMFFGIVVSAIGGLIGVLVKTSVRGSSEGVSARPLMKGLTISVIGSVVQFGAMAYDYYAYSGWGFAYGYISAPVALLGLGTVVCGVGSFMGASRMLQFSIWGSQALTLLNKKVLGWFFVFGGVALWLQLNLLIYWYPVDQYLRQYVLGPNSLQFGNVSDPIAGILFAIPATLVLTGMTRISKKFHYSVMAGLVFMVANFVSTISPQGYTFYLPLEAALIVPILFSSIWIGNKLFVGSRSKVWEGTLLAPFGYLLAFPISVAYAALQSVKASNYLAFAWSSLYVLAIPSIVIGLMTSVYLSRWFARVMSADEKQQAEIMIPA